MPFANKHCKHYLNIFVMLCVSINRACAIDYSINSIPDSLKTNAGAVIRECHTTLDIPNIYSATYTEGKTISILNASKEDMALIRLDYNDRESIRDFKALVYDASGNIIYRSKDQDIYDMSATTNQLATSLRYKILNLKKCRAPFTVRVSFIKEFRETFLLPEWFPAQGTEVSIENADLKISYGKDVVPNFKSEKLGTPRDSANSSFWQISAFDAIKKEDYIPSIRQLLPHTTVMLNSFELYDVKGSSGTWNDIGVFINDLNNGRDVLKHIDDQELKRILGSSIDTLSKIKALYKYLQSNFRYVNVALGIGGWQPQEASVTLKEKYGDCKALAMVMKAMLKKTGIPSFYCLVYADPDAGAFNLLPDFPYPGFNHVVLSVPMGKDTLWLECTSNNSPFNYMGTFTSGRQALMVFDGGGRLVKTPEGDEGITGRTTSAHIKTTNEATSINARVKLSGKIQEIIKMVLDKSDQTPLKQLIGASANIKNSTVNSYNIDPPNPDSPSLVIAFDLSNENTIHKTESRIFVKTDIFQPFNNIPDKNDKRTQAVNVSMGFNQSDTIVYMLPVGYSPENFNIDDAKTYADQFGYANCSIKYIGGTGELTLIRNFCLKHGVYPANQYTPFREFLLKSMKICCPELVLKLKG